MPGPRASLGRNNCAIQPCPLLVLKLPPLVPIPQAHGPGDHWRGLAPRGGSGCISSHFLWWQELRSKCTHPVHSASPAAPSAVEGRERYNHCRRMAPGPPVIPKVKYVGDKEPWGGAIAGRDGAWGLTDRPLPCPPGVLGQIVQSLQLGWPASCELETPDLSDSVCQHVQLQWKISRTTMRVLLGWKMLPVSINCVF